MIIKPIVRPFSVNDAVQIFNLLQDVSAFRVPDAQVADFADKFIRLDNARAFVVLNGSRVIGFGSVFFYCRIRGGVSAILEDMVVAHDWRGKGIGRMLLRELIVCARERGCFKIALESSIAANDFYRASGFQDGGQSMKLFF